MLPSKGTRACPPVRDHQGHNSLQARIAGPFLSVSQPPKQGANNSISLGCALYYRTATEQPWTETSDQPCCAAQPGAGLPTTLHLSPLESVFYLPSLSYTQALVEKAAPLPAASLGETRDG